MQKIVNLLDNSENEYPKFPTKEWYVVDSESKGVYSYHDAIKFLTKSWESIFVIILMHVFFSQKILLLQGWMTKVLFKNWVPFRKCRTEINENFIDEAEHINIAMSMYNLIENSDILVLQEVCGSLKETK